MPTPFEQARNAKRDGRSGDWSARLVQPRRSVFGNYCEEESEDARPSDRPLASAKPAVTPLQSAIDGALARSFLYRAIAKAYEDPTPEEWAVLTAAGFQKALAAALATRALHSPGLAEAARVFALCLTSDSFESFQSAHLACFGHAARGSCPLNEIEYGDIKADGLFQPHRLADLAAFYRAFGLELADDAAERQDHLCLELEFMSVLAAKEAYALEHQLDPEELTLCRDMQKQFLREHLGRWTPAFSRRLAHMAGNSPLGALARFTRAFIESECAHFGVAAGSEDLLLRPVDEAGESLCSSCSLTQLPPGALAAEGTTRRIH